MIFSFVQAKATVFHYWKVGQ